MRFILFFLFGICSLFGFGQIELLDNKYGYKDFIFDTSPFDYSNLKKMDSVSYLYAGDDVELFKVFDVKFDFLMLDFNAKGHTLEDILLIKVYEIKTPTMQADIDATSEDFVSILLNYKEVLGEATSIDDSDKTDLQYYWFGDKVGLYVRNYTSDIKIDDEGNPVFTIQTKVHFKKLGEDKTKSPGF